MGALLMTKVSIQIFIQSPWIIAMGALSMTKVSIQIFIKLSWIIAMGALLVTKVSIQIFIQSPRITGYKQTEVCLSYQLSIMLDSRNSKSNLTVRNRENDKSKLTRPVQDSKFTIDKMATSPTNSELVVLGWICHFLDSELVVLGHGFFKSYLYRINVNLSSECECGGIDLNLNNFIEKIQFAMSKFFVLKNHIKLQRFISNTKIGRIITIHNTKHPIHIELIKCNKHYLTLNLEKHNSSLKIIFNKSKKRNKRKNISVLQNDHIPKLNVKIIRKRIIFNIFVTF
ncbi:hypothetical protein DERF_006936, partial [Dermatophagoides farinae]